ncbi:MAG TPA: sodium:proton antiporter NhaD [Flavobacteriales bacterium]|nr:sodium:proton antiporter NhaD [Flavobacteriales bacterium]
MLNIILAVFVLGYGAIAFEHPLKINKSGSALLMGILIWTLYRIGWTSDDVAGELEHHLTGIAEILFFLMGAMTIVEVIDAHDGFNLITNRINTKSKIKLLWIMAILAFFLSAILDNLTTTIVMVSLARKLIPDEKQRLFFAGMTVISANAGGAWSPIGDVTTTMLWIGGQVSTLNIMKVLFFPSLVCMFIPLFYVSLFEKKTLKGDLPDRTKQKLAPENKLIFSLGLGGLILVPVFKQLTHLPPYVGMMLALGIIWIAADLIHRKKGTEEQKKYSASNALMKIDMPSLLFFLGILLAVSGLESLHVLKNVATWMDTAIGNKDLIVICIGVLSAVVDNVPLVAATMGMYDLSAFPTDHKIWEFIAYCAGTGGSILIIGSAAGVAAMGMEKIDFLWYFKKMGLIAFLGYIAGAGIYLLQYALFHS